MRCEGEEKREGASDGAFYALILYLDFTLYVVMKLLGTFKLENDLIGSLF